MKRRKRHPASPCVTLRGPSRPQLPPGPSLHCLHSPWRQPLQRVAQQRGIGRQLRRTQATKDARQAAPLGSSWDNHEILAKSNIGGVIIMLESWVMGLCWDDFVGCKSGQVMSSSHVSGLKTQLLTLDQLFWLVTVKKGPSLTTKQWEFTNTKRTARIQPTRKPSQIRIQWSYGRIKPTSRSK